MTRTRGRWILGAWLGCCLALQLSAQVLYWDTNGSSYGSGSTPNGTWKNTSSSTYKKWTTNANGTSSTTRWTDGSTAVFSAGSDAANANYTVNVSGTVKPGATKVEDGNVSFSGGQINWNDSTPDFTVNSGSWASVNSTEITGYQGLNKYGDGVLVLNGTNSYTGPTKVYAGILSLTHDGALGSPTTWSNSVASGASLGFSNNITINTGQFSIAGSGYAGAGALINYGGDNTFNSTVTVSAAATLTNLGGSLTLAGGGNMELNANLTINSWADTTLSNQIYGAGSLTQNGGTLTFNGTVGNSFNGDLNINQGTAILAKSDGERATGQGQLNIGDGRGHAGTAVVRLEGNDQIADYLSSVNVRSDGLLDLNNHREAINILNGTGGTIDLGATGQLTVGINSGSSTFAGNLTGTGNLIKAGEGSFTLGSDLTFDGTLTLQAGTLALHGFDLSLGTLNITGNSIIDFGAGLSSNLFTDSLLLADGITLTIKGWTDTVDAFYATYWSGATADTTGSAPTTQIVFQGFSSNDTRWIGVNGEVSPVPEPTTYGALFTAAGLTLWWRRRRVRPAPGV